MHKLNRKFYLRDAVTVAKELIGKVFVRKTSEGITSGRIVETEAYMGTIDKASHAYGGARTKRTEIQYGIGGFLYVYVIYGCHHCMNIVANRLDRPESVLIRAIEPLDGVSLMKERRNQTNLYALCNGPAKLCQALQIDKTCYGTDLCGDEIWLEQPSAAFDPCKIISSKRINIDYAQEAADYLWRFSMKDSPFASKK